MPLSRRHNVPGGTRRQHVRMLARVLLDVRQVAVEPDRVLLDDRDCCVDGAVRVARRRTVSRPYYVNVQATRKNERSRIWRPDARDHAP